MSDLLIPYRSWSQFCSLNSRLRLDYEYVVDKSLLSLEESYCDLFWPNNVFEHLCALGEGAWLRATLGRARMFCQCKARERAHALVSLMSNRDPEESVASLREDMVRSVNFYFDYFQDDWNEVIDTSFVFFDDFLLDVMSLDAYRQMQLEFCVGARQAGSALSCLDDDAVKLIWHFFEVKWVDKLQSPKFAILAI